MVVQSYCIFTRTLPYDSLVSFVPLVPLTEVITSLLAMTRSGLECHSERSEESPRCEYTMCVDSCRLRGDASRCSA
jgi:hypothetical protein